MISNWDKFLFGALNSITSLFFYVFIPLGILTFILLKLNKGKKLSKRQKKLLLISGLLLTFIYPKMMEPYGWGNFGNYQVYPTYQEELGCFGLKSKMCINIPEGGCAQTCYGIPTGNKKCYILDSSDGINVKKTEIECTDPSNFPEVGPLKIAILPIEPKIPDKEEECRTICESRTNKQCKNLKEICIESGVSEFTEFLSVGITNICEKYLKENPEIKDRYECTFTTYSGKMEFKGQSTDSVDCKFTCK